MGIRSHGNWCSLSASSSDIKTWPLKARASLATVRVNPKDGLPYVYLRPGKFQMGCSGSDCSGNDDPHPVAITKGFWMGQTEVTQGAYKRVMRERDPSSFKGDNRPVERASWNQADAYCHAVDMRLPTEAEWEYAARAGNTNERYADIDKIAVYGTSEYGNGRLKTAECMGPVRHAG